MHNHLSHSPLHAVMLFVVFAMLTGFAACSREAKPVIAEPQMEDILYEYHLLNGMKDILNIDSAQARAYLQAIFDKYGVTQQDFDSSMVYYMRHTDTMHEIYKRLSARIDKEATAQGADNNGFDFISGDTANVWRGATARIFSLNAPYNVLQFSVPVDTAYKAGDKLLLSFNSDFMYESGTRNGLALLSVTLGNDSVVTRTTAFSSSMAHTIEISDDKRLGIKQIQGFFLQKQSSMKSERNSTATRMMIISNIKLIRMHLPEEPATTAVENADSLSVANPDTIEASAPLPAESQEETTATAQPVQPVRTPIPPPRELVQTAR